MDMENEQSDIGTEENLSVNERPAEPTAGGDGGTAYVPSELMQLNQLVEEFGGVEKLAALLRGIAANAESRRSELVGALAANSACAFTADDLHALPIGHLEKLYRSLTPGNYAGRPPIPAAPLAAGEFLIGNDVFRPYRGVTQ